MKIGKREKKLSLRTAIIAGYLDVCRRPLQGLNNIIFENSRKTSVEVRNEFVDHHFLQAIELLKTRRLNFDSWHKELCKSIYNYYDEKGYSEFFVGKAQKWINMSLKYIWLYSEESFVDNYIQFFHVPIDRYIANDIAKKIGLLPGYLERRFDDLDGNFDSEKVNYCWSKINCYIEYLECQKKIRENLRDKTPIEWEFECWLKNKN